MQPSCQGAARASSRSGAKANQLLAQPLRGGDRIVAVAFHVIGEPAQAALRGGLVDEFLGSIDFVVLHEVVILAPQMLFAAFGVVPGTVAIKLATRIENEIQQVLDLLRRA